MTRPIRRGGVRLIEMQGDDTVTAVADMDVGGNYSLGISATGATREAALLALTYRLMDRDEVDDELRRKREQLGVAEPALPSVN